MGIAFIVEYSAPANGGIVFKTQVEEGRMAIKRLHSTAGVLTGYNAISFPFCYHKPVHDPIIPGRISDHHVVTVQTLDIVRIDDNADGISNIIIIAVTILHGQI